MKDGSGNAIAGSGTSSISYSASLSAVNTALGTLTYTAGSSALTDTLVLQISDQTGATIAGDTFVVVSTGTVANPPDFQLTSNVSSLSISAGQSGSLTLAVTPQNGFNSQVAFACSGGSGVLSCSFNPATVTPSGGGAAHATVTVNAASQSATSKISPLPGPWEGLATALLLLAWKRKAAWFPCMVLVGALLLPLNGCGGSGSTTPVTNPPVTYTLTVTATSGTLQHTVQIQTTVQ